MSRSVPTLLLSFLLTAPPTANASVKTRFLGFCEWALSRMAPRKAIFAPQEAPATNAEPVVAEPAVPSHEPEPVPDPVATLPTPVEHLEIHRPSTVRLTHLARRQADEQNLSDSEVLQMLSSPAVESLGRDHFKAMIALRGSQAATGLDLKRSIEFWRPKGRNQAVVRHIFPPLELAPRARIDLTRAKLSFVDFEKMMAQVQRGSIHSVGDDLWEARIARKRSHPLRVLYRLHAQRAYVYSVREISPQQPKTKPYRLKEIPVDVEGTWMTELAKKMWESDPFEIDHALDQLSNLEKTEGQESYRFNYIDRSKRARSIEFVEDDRYGIVILKIFEVEKREPSSAKTVLPFVITDVTERTLKFWNMTSEDLVTLFRNRKGVPRPIGENPFGYDPTREHFASTTSRPIKKAGFGRRFQVITSSTASGAKPVVLSIHPLKPIEKSSNGIAEEVARPEPASQEAPIPFHDLSELVSEVLKFDEASGENVIRKSRPELFESFSSLNRIGAEFLENMRLLRANEEMRTLINEENSALEQRMTSIVDDILDRTLETGRNEIQEVLLEIRADDSAEWSKTFAADLRRTYERYAQAKKWEFSAIESSPHPLIHIRGRGAWHFMRLEEGLQRRVVRSGSGKRDSRERTHTARLSVTVIKGPQLPAVARTLFDERRMGHPLPFVRSYHMPANRVSDERISRTSIAPAEVLEQGQLHAIHLQIENQLLISAIERLLGRQ